MKNITQQNFNHSKLNHFITVIGLLIFFQTGLIQTCVSQRPFKQEVYKVRVLKSRTKLIASGYLYQMQDSSILISHSLYRPTFDEKDLINIQYIGIIKFRKKGKLGRSILYGTLTGLATGVIIGYASGDDDSFLFSSASEKSAIAGFFLMIPGAIIGAIVGSAGIKIPLKGDYNEYEKRKMELENYLIKYK